MPQPVERAKDRSQVPSWYKSLRHGIDTLEQLIESSLSAQRGRAELQSDEHSSHALHTLDLGNTPQLVFGRITYVLPYLHWYRVQLDGLNSEISCCLLGRAALPFATVEGDPLPPGARVMVALDPGARWSYIVGAVPDPVADGQVVFPDCQVPEGGTGYKRDPYLHEVLQLFEAEGGAIDWSNWRPLDSNALGEFSQLSTLGGRLRVGAVDQQLAISEACGLELFEQDQFARLSGYNYEQLTSSTRQEVLNDGGEAVNYQGSTPYPHEALGLLEAGLTATQLTDSEDWQYNQLEGPRQPDPPDLTGFYRLEEHRGYLGQGYLRQLAAPASAQGTHALSQSTAHPGLFREHLALTGAWHVESAYGFGFWKRAAIPWPKRVRRPEDPQGDDQDGSDYRFAGQFGSGPPHRIQAAPAATGHLASQKAVVDVNSYLAHQFNWQALHAFHYHQRDWYTPEQSAGELSQLVQPPDYSRLQHQQWLTPPSPHGLTVDPRYGEVDYYPTMAGYQVLPSGNSTMLGGQGCELRMVDGNLYISAPGDIHLLAGRRVVSWSGDDTILRANRSMDLTVNQLDLRLKAGQNLETVSGVSGRGRTLLENQATSQDHNYENRLGEDVEGSGILLKTEHGQLATYAASTYIRSGGAGLNSGPLVLDAGQGEEPLRMVARDVHFHVANQITESFPLAGTKEAANVRSAVANRLGASLEVGGTLVVTEGGAIVNGHLNVAGGHVSSQQAEQFNGLLGSLQGASLSQAQASIGQADIAQRQLRMQERLDFELGLEQTHYSDPQSGLGHAEFIRRLGFSFRTEQQYGSEGYELPEMHWQHQAGSTGATWTEQPVTHQNQETYPFPGRGPWKEQEAFLRLDPALYNPQAGIDRPRGGGDYEGASHNDWNPQTLDGNYPVVVT